MKLIRHSIPYTFITTLLFYSTAWSLEDDRQQPIQIGSSSAFADYKKGLTIYKGEVVLSQGSLKILAEQLSVHRDENGFQKLVATGNPASFQQTPSPGDKPILAEANQIEYHVTDEVLILKGSVFIKLDESSHRGSYYEYNLVTQMLKASGDTENRVITTFQPKNNSSNKQAN